MVKPKSKFKRPRIILALVVLLVLVIVARVSAASNDLSRTETPVVWTWPLFLMMIVTVPSGTLLKSIGSDFLAGSLVGSVAISFLLIIVEIVHIQIIEVASIFAIGNTGFGVLF